jgi:uncharacterized membrane protein YfcA
MLELGSNIYWLTAILFVVAFVYSSVGLGGGSSYTAWMAIFGINYLAIPIVSLTLNVIATTIGAINFIRYHHARWGLILPFLFSSIPMAYVGGSIPLPRHYFLLLLWASLVFVAIRIYLFDQVKLELNLNKQQELAISIVSGMILGFIAGVVGIGGGIYLIPLILILGLGTAKEAAACGVIFIWVNSVVGLSARFIHQPIDLSEYLPLIVAVIVGSALGSYLGASRYSPKVIEKILGLIILVAIVLLGKTLISAF